jgi:hypothetical protein
MEVHFAPETEQMLQDLAERSGRASVDEVVRGAEAGYFSELEQTSAMLDGRYDDLKSGRVALISGDEVAAHFQEKSAAARRSLPRG